MAIKTQFTELYFIDPDGGDVVEVGCVTSIDGLDAARDQIETTCLDSESRTYVGGMPTPGAATFTINADPSDPSHIRLHELYREGTTLDWAIGWGDGFEIPPTGDSSGFTLPSTRTWLTFEAYLAGFPFSFTLNSVVTSAIPLQVASLPVWTAKTT
jgi:hypothetical protein